MDEDRTNSEKVTLKFLDVVLCSIGFYIDTQHSNTQYSNALILKILTIRMLRRT